MSAREQVERIARWLYGRQCEVPKPQVETFWATLCRAEQLHWRAEARAVIREVKKP